jgi:CRISPR-associated protein Csx17
MEMLIALRDRKSKPNLNRPLSGLSPAWIQKADDGDIEVRLAAALSSIQAIGAVGPLRAQMAGVDSQRPWQWGEEGSKVWVGSRLTDRLGNVLVRRLQEAERSQMSYPPFEAYIPLCAADVMPFLWGLFQETRLEELLWGFSLIDWRKGGLQQVKRAWEKPKDEAVLSRTFALLKLLHPPKSLPGKKMKTDFRIAHLLRAGRVNEACRLAKQRLMVMEAQPLEADYQENLDPFRILASLLIPVRDVWRLERLVLADTHGKS